MKKFALEHDSERGLVRINVIENCGEDKATFWMNVEVSHDADVEFFKHLVHYANLGLVAELRAKRGKAELGCDVEVSKEEMKKQIESWRDRSPLL